MPRWVWTICLPSLFDTPPVMQKVETRHPLLLVITYVPWDQTPETHRHLPLFVKSWFQRPDQTVEPHHHLGCPWFVRDRSPPTTRTAFGYITCGVLYNSAFRLRKMAGKPQPSILSAFTHGAVDISQVIVKLGCPSPATPFS